MKLRFPPSTRETAMQKVRLAKDGWSSRDPQRVSLVYMVGSQWLKRFELINDREQIVVFATCNGRAS